MPPREPQVTPPKTFAINSSRDLLEKLKREIERLAGSIIRQEVVDHGLNAAMTAWHLTDWTWGEIQGSIPRLRCPCSKFNTARLRAEQSAGCLADLTRLDAHSDDAGHRPPRR